jgi:hypothetical protein
MLNEPTDTEKRVVAVAEEYMDAQIQEQSQQNKDAGKPNTTFVLSTADISQAVKDKLNIGLSMHVKYLLVKRYQEVGGFKATENNGRIELSVPRKGGRSKTIKTDVTETVQPTATPVEVIATNETTQPEAA